ncbi:unnamed protein product [Parnassius apollo]|uniref:(apollo) hypothetical protein n=1 Tax=Parnassius apollo TaxID=110799 RepID=A0A8S3WUF2_PARAO|nr:unnamed protein product [Parnassius apollo]
MTESVEGGAALAGRLFATLEGGSLLLATFALLAYTARWKVTASHRRKITNVLVTNTTNALGKELTRKLKSHGCTVCSVINGATATSGADLDKVDALVVIGAEIKQDGLDGIAQIVTDDIFNNLKLLENLSPLVLRGGCMAWACAGKMSGGFRGACTAYDDVLRATLQHTAESCHCEPVWIGRCEDVERVAERIVASLLPCTNQQHASLISIRNAAQKLREYFGRWLKIVT